MVSNGRGSFGPKCGGFGWSHKELARILTSLNKGTPPNEALRIMSRTVVEPKKASSRFTSYDNIAELNIECVDSSLARSIGTREKAYC